MYKVNQVQMGLQTNVPSGKHFSQMSGCSPKTLHVSPDKQVKKVSMSFITVTR